MTAQVRCAACGQQWNTGTATDRFHRFNTHQCDQLPATDTATFTPKTVTIAAAMLVALMLTDWMVQWVAGFDWLTPVAMFIALCAASSAIWVFTERVDR